MDALWVFDASTTELNERLSFLLARNLSTQHRHIVQIIQEELQERACYAEFEQLLLREVKLDQEHVADLYLQHQETCSSDATGAASADAAAAPNQQCCLQHVGTALLTQIQQSSQHQLALHRDISTAVAPQHEQAQPVGQQSTPALQTPAEGVQQLQPIGLHDLKLAAPQLQQSEQQGAQQGMSAVPQQFQQQQPQGLQAFATNQAAGLTPLQAAQQAFLEEQQRIRKARLALHKPQTTHGRPAAAKKSTSPASVKAQTHTTAQQQPVSLQQLQQHSMQACKQQHDKWHTVTGSQCGVRQTAQQSQLKQEQRATETVSAHEVAVQPPAAVHTSAGFGAFAGPCSCTPPQPGHQANTEGLAIAAATVPTCAGAMNTDPSARTHDSGNAARPKVAVTNAASAAVMAAAAPELSASVSASTAAASEDSTETGLATPAAVAGAAHGASLTAAAAPAGAKAADKSQSATDTNLQQPASLTTFRDITPENAAVATVEDPADNAALENRADRRALRGDMAPGFPAPAAVIAGCRREQHMVVSAGQDQPRVHLDLQDGQQGPTAAGPPTVSVEVSQQQCHQQEDTAVMQQNNSTTLVAPLSPPQQQTTVPAAVAQHDPSSMLVADRQVPKPAGLIAWQSSGEPPAAPQPHYQPVYNRATGRAGVHQPLQLDSWRDWDAMSSSMDETHDGFGAWGAAQE